MGRLDNLLAEALKLPEDDRARLALRLAESLSPLPSQSAPSAWAAEITRRVARLREGSAKTVPADVAVAEARAALASRRG
jgi:putative addiction module component (TIGR02574 family)